VPDPDDDERFKAYLRRFQPLAAKPLPLEKAGQVRRPSRALAACAAAAAAILVTAVFAWYSWPRRSEAIPTREITKRTDPLVNTEPLTIRRADALLATAPSFTAAIDAMALRPKATPLPKDKRSALEVLGEEKNKL
jgi:hypothetical protein